MEVFAKLKIIRESQLKVYVEVNQRSKYSTVSLT